jgi:hypothetical protein
MHLCLGMALGVPCDHLGGNHAEIDGEPTDQLVWRGIMGGCRRDHYEGRD